MAVTLRELTVLDVSDRYVGWLNDPEVSRFLETRFEPQTFDKVRAYVESIALKKTERLFGIFLDQAHIGNLKIGAIKPHHSYAEISLFIGEKSEWGKGRGTEAIRLATDIAFTNIGLHKLVAGMYSGNQGSYRAFIKNGYREVGVWQRHRLFDGGWMDQISVEKITPCTPRP